MKINDLIKEKKDFFNNLLKKEFSQYKEKYSKTIYDAMYYSVFSGGKRIRPIIVMFSCEFLGKNFEDVANFAIALEYIHTYSLIHDDLPCMDNDDYRRGKLTCHKKFNEGVAVLAGDALLNLAYEIMINSVKKNNKMIEALSFFADQAGCNGMIGGQIVDIAGKNLSENDIIDMYNKKTGGLIKCGILLPYFLMNKDIQLYNELYQFGEKLGFIFQLTDDLLEKNQDEKNSYLMLNGREKTENTLIQTNKDIHNILKKYSQRASNFLELVDYITYRKK